MTDYTGAGPVPGCTPDQNSGIDVLLNMVPAQGHDGLRREIATALDGVAGDHSDGEVLAVVKRVLTDHSGVQIPQALFAGATPVADTKRRVPRG
jgi:hypothetical protein